MIERRFFPRYHCEMQFKLHGEKDQEFFVNCEEISEAGLSFMVSLSILNSLADAGQAMEIGNRFQITLPADPQFELSIECQIMHMRRLSQEHYLIGVWFGKLSEQDRAIMDRLISNAKIHNEE